MSSPLWTLVKSRKRARGRSNDKRLSASRSTTSNRTTTSSKNQNAVGIPSSGTSTVLLDLPIDMRICIFNYLGETHEERITLSLVSKQTYEDCKRPGIERKIIPTIVITPRLPLRFQHRLGKAQASTRALLQQFFLDAVRDNERNMKLRRYPHMKVNDVDKFDYIFEEEVASIFRFDSRKMDWILSLDITISPTTPCWKVEDSRSLPNILATMLPNLREIDLSNACITRLKCFSFRCPYLEKVTWKNIDKDSCVELDGCNMRYSNNLKEIIMDDSEFVYDQRVKDTISNLENYGNNFIFHYCSEALERVSIRNAKVCEKLTRDEPTVAILQNALIKFVLNAPSSLRWFRSDLTQENIDMLKLERPKIECRN